MPIAASFTDVVLAVHVGAVVVGFGGVFALPVMFAVAQRTDPRSLPTLHRVAQAITQRLVGPGLAVVVVAGVYLASKEHLWKSFFVGWGIGVALLIGALLGMFVAPRQRQLVALGGGDSDEEVDLARVQRELALAGWGIAVLVLVTILFMALHLGAS